MVERVLKKIGNNKHTIPSIGEGWGVGGLREGIGVKAHLNGPMDAATKMKIAIPVGRSGPARKKRYTSSREEGGVDEESCPCDKAIKNSHPVARYELHREERDVLEGGGRVVNEGGLYSFDA